MNSENPKFAKLADFQARLLTVLHSGGTGEKMRADLLQAATDAQLLNYVSGFDDRMLVVASELVRKWGARTR